jgi:hypothetical protein
VDFFGMARPLIREPDLPNRWLEGKSVESKCISCNNCFNASGPLHCFWGPGVGTEQHNPSELRIYPNPVQDILYIEVPDTLRGGFEVVISDLNGREIFTSFGNMKQLDLSSFQKGVYLITIRSEGFVATEQIMKL